MAFGSHLGRYADRTPRSRALHESAQRWMPGGNTRSSIFIDPYPFYVTKGEGARVWDADGHALLDFNGNYTVLVLGHAPEPVVSAVKSLAGDGICFPGPSEHEIDLARILIERVESCEQIRFTNSGTEATMMALRGARAFTGRAKVAKFEGAFHGSHDWVQVSTSPGLQEAGSRHAPLSVATGAGVPQTVLDHVVVLPWNDPEACVELIEREARELACVICEPMLGIGGLVAAAPGFLERVREVTARLGIVMILDEVMTYRVAPGGMQSKLGLIPDLTTFGKIIGGGFPIGGFGGRADIMAVFDPRGGHPPVVQGGTFNANPLTMAAGVATLNALTPAVYEHLDRLGERLRNAVERLFAARQTDAQITGEGSLFCLHWTSEPIVSYRSTRPRDPEQPMRTYVGLLNEDIVLSQRGLGCLCAAMEDSDVDRFVGGLDRVLELEKDAGR